METLYETTATLINCLDNIEMQLVPCHDKFKHLSSHRGSVLIFLPGIEEIVTLRKKLEEFAKKSVALTFCQIIPLHSEMSVEEQLCVINSPSFNTNEAAYTRRIILSTSIAESSLTIPDIMYVVDFCLHKTVVSQSHTRISSIKVVSKFVNRICFKFLFSFYKHFRLNGLRTAAV